ncbi:MAG: N-6 DNA methylase [Asgard group archaeon]|nr:N-6 DNA methylase [Asgard group archaeon]
MFKSNSGEKTIFDQFLVKYLSLENQLLNNNQSFTAKQFHELFYFLVKKVLLDKFQINFISGNKNDILELVKTNNDFNEQDIRLLIEDELIKPFRFSLKEDLRINDMITPYIFSLIFETSLHLETKQRSGSYYTEPLEVNYMCAEALFYYLSTTLEFDKSKLAKLIWKQDNSTTLDLSEDDSKTLLSYINKIRLIDPACGSGAIIIGFINLVYRLNSQLLSQINNQIDANELILDFIKKQLFGLDINEEAIIVAKIRLDAFLLANGIEWSDNQSFNLFKINALVEDLDFISKGTEFLFDIVIGNPPYIRQEQFTKSNELEKSIDDYKSLIINRLELFLENKLIIPRNRKSDFYVFFFYRALSLLNENGLLCFITSNSWLDAKFGNNFRKILLEHFSFNSIQTSAYTKSFSSAINTIIVLLTKKSSAHLDDTHLVHFEIFKKSIGEIIKTHLNTFVSQKITHNSSNEIEISSVLQRNLYPNLSDLVNFKNKWGSYYLRAPKELIDVLENNQDKLTTMHSIAKIRYPIKTGLNDFFIVDEDTRDKFSIEPEFLIPLLKSPKKISSYLITPNILKYKLFICDKSKETLKLENKNGALKYIEWGEEQFTQTKQQTKEGMRWSQVPSVLAHIPYWYTLPKIPPADIFCNRFYDRRFFFCYSNAGIIEDQTFYGLLLNQSIKKEKILFLGLLNSTFNYLLLEIFGRTALGKGALQYSINDFKVLPIINPSKLPKELKNQIIEKTSKLLKNNKITSLFTELNIPERLALDKILFNWLGIKDSEINHFYELIKELVSNRLQKSGQKIRS